MTDRLEGVVAVNFGRQALVDLPNRPEIPCLIRGRKLKPVCGDRVQVEPIAGTRDHAIVTVLPERNHFVRVDKRLRPHKIAANLDLIWIVVAVDPPPSQDLINSYLVAAHALDIEPGIVLNKTDLGLPDTGLIARINTLEQLGYPVYRTSSRQGDGMQVWREATAGLTQILVGQSGVGKSSLIRFLLPGRPIATGKLARLTGKGAHTTTHTRRHPLPEGGWLIDSPGVWEFGIWHMQPTEIAAGFIEFRPKLGDCRFNDCTHVHEPGCAIIQAVQDRQITRERWQSYTRILETLSSRG